MLGIHDVARLRLAAVGGNLSLRSIRVMGVACVGLARRRIDLSTPYIYISQWLTRNHFTVEERYR